MGQLVSYLDAKYIVLFKTADYEAYGFLQRQYDLQSIFEGDGIPLFRNLTIYSTTQITEIPSFSALPADLRR